MKKSVPHINKNTFLRITVALATIIPLTSCILHDGECHQDKNVKLGCEFYQTAYDSINETYSARPLNSITTVHGLDNDSLLYDSVRTNSVYLPLNNFDTTCAFVLQRDTLTSDTLTLHYHNNDNFISIECGCIIQHTLTDFDITTHQIDSVILLKNFIGDAATKHLRVFFKE